MWRQLIRPAALRHGAQRHRAASVKMQAFSTGTLPVKNPSTNPQVVVSVGNPYAMPVVVVGLAVAGGTAYYMATAKARKIKERASVAVSRAKEKVHTKVEEVRQMAPSVTTKLEDKAAEKISELDEEEAIEKIKELRQKVSTAADKGEALLKELWRENDSSEKPTAIQHGGTKKPGKFKKRPPPLPTRWRKRQLPNSRSSSKRADPASHPKRKKNIPL